MGAISNISWTHSTLNPWIGCTKFAAECANCYADQMDRTRFSRMLGEGTPESPVRHWGEGAPRHRTRALEDGTLLKWNQKAWVCQECGPIRNGLVFGPECGCGRRLEHRRVFIGSLMDWADEAVPDSWRDDLFDQADRATNLRLLFLTKRGENAYRYLNSRYPNGCPPHFWIGMSWMQDRPDDVRWLLKIQARVRWLSVEPMLGPVDFTRWTEANVCQEWAPVKPFVDWVIFGGESGPNARLCNVGWIRDGVRQCRAAGVRSFVKQMGSVCVCDNANLFDWPEAVQLEGTDLVTGAASCRVRFKDRKGGDPEEWPEDLRVQEVPDA